MVRTVHTLHMRVQDPVVNNRLQDLHTMLRNGPSEKKECSRRFISWSQEALEARNKETKRKQAEVARERSIFERKAVVTDWRAARRRETCQV